MDGKEADFLRGNIYIKALNYYKDTKNRSEKGRQEFNELFLKPLMDEKIRKQFSKSLNFGTKAKQKEVQIDPNNIRAKFNLK